MDQLPITCYLGTRSSCRGVYIRKCNVARYSRILDPLSVLSEGVLRYFSRVYSGCFDTTSSTSSRGEIGARSVRDRCEIGARSGRKRCGGKYFPCAAAGQMRGRIGARSVRARFSGLRCTQPYSVYSVKISGLRCTRPYSVYSAMLGSCSIMVRAVLIHDARAVLNLVRYSSVDTRIRYSG